MIGAPALLALATALALLAFAPPESKHLWAMNGFRSVPTLVRLLAVATALAFAATARSSRLLLALCIVLAAALVFPGRESIHWLGDTSLRLHAIHNAAQPGASVDDWRRILHAEPVDLLLNFEIPVFLTSRFHVAETTAVSIVSLLLAECFIFGVWRLARVLCADARLRPAVAALLLLTGSLEVFAGYAESAGVFLVAVTWWLVWMLEPVDRVKRVVLVVAGWFALIFVHRMALLLLPALLVKAFTPGSAPVRKWFVLATVLAGAVAITLALSGPTSRLGADYGELSQVTFANWRSHVIPFSDLLNLMVIVAPLDFFAVFLVSREGFSRLTRSGDGYWLAAAIAPLIVLAIVQPVTPSGLGAQRDWDLAVVPGFLITVLIVYLMQGLPAPRRRALSYVLIPTLAFQVACWVGVSANTEASVNRAVTLAFSKDLPPAQASHLFMFLGERAIEVGNPRLSAHFYEKAFELHGNPRRALASASSWLAAGEPGQARRLIGMARAAGGLTPELTLAAANMDSSIDSLAAARLAGH
jgi:hypothetical protein